MGFNENDNVTETSSFCELSEAENIFKQTLLNCLNVDSSNIDNDIERLYKNFNECDDCANFIHRFSIAVCEILHEAWLNSGIENARDCPVLEQIMKKYVKFFKTYIDKADDLEMQCLMTVHKFIHELQYPPGLLLKLFELLYDFKLISYDSFIKWENANMSRSKLPMNGGAGLSPLYYFFINIKVAKKSNECSPNDEGKETTNASNDVEQVEELWKPNRMLPKSSNWRVNDDPLKGVTSILNKLTPQNFDKLVDDMSKLRIDTVTKLQSVVVIVHKKAIREWKFCSLYAELCYHIQGLTVYEMKVSQSFRTLLINLCQQYYENSFSEDSKFLRRKAHINSLLNEAARKKLFQKYELDEYIFRKESVGNIRLIGELYKLSIITTKIVFRILDRLIENGKNMAIECLCALVSTIGQFHEKKKGDLPNHYFEKIRELSDQKNLSLRLRFMLMDVIDLKNNSWRPRFEPELPKTLLEIELELQEKKELTQLASAVPSFGFKHGSKSSSISDTSPSKKWIPINELRKICRCLFKQYVKHEDVQPIVNTIEEEFLSHQIPKLIFSLIEYVIENDGKNAACCGEMLVNLLDRKVISTTDVVKGLSSLLKNNGEISRDLERVLGPLFLGEYLKLDDLNMIFENICKKKQSKAARLKEKVEVAETNKVAGEKTSAGVKDIKYYRKEEAVNKNSDQDPNRSSDSLKKDSNGSEKNDNDTSVGDGTGLNAKSAGGFSQINSNSENLSPSRTESSGDNQNIDLEYSNETVNSSPRSLKLIRDLFNELTPEMYRRQKYRSKLSTFPFKRVDQLQNAASCIIEMVYNYPDLYKFYAEVCNNMKSLAVGQSLFWSILTNECKNYFDKIINDEALSSERNSEPTISLGESSTLKSDEQFTNKLNGFCRFLTELIRQKVITEVDVLTYFMQGVIYHNPECFCDIFELVGKQKNFKYSDLSFHIRQVLAEGNLKKLTRTRLQKIWELCKTTTKEEVTYEHYLQLLNEVKKLQELEKRNSEELEKHAKELERINNLIKRM